MDEKSKNVDGSGGNRDVLGGMDGLMLKKMMTRSMTDLLDGLEKHLSTSNIAR